jgi:hypothetical protein
VTPIFILAAVPEIGTPGIDNHREFTRRKLLHTGCLIRMDRGRARVGAPSATVGTSAVGRFYNGAGIDLNASKLYYTDYTVTAQHLIQ